MDWATAADYEHNVAYFTASFGKARLREILVE